MASVTLDAVTVSLGDTPVLQDVSLHVADGELLAVVGPSGSGKSTLLRVVAGLVSPSAGDVLIAGRSMHDVPVAERDVAMVFQDSVLYPTKTAGENVGFPLEIRKLAAAEIEQRVESEARVLALERYLDRLPRELSAGHQQMVQVGRAMVRAPAVFLLDEPLARLDTPVRTRMRSELRLLQSGYEVTTLYVTNDATEAMAIADRVVVIGRGRVVQIGAPLEIYHRPRSRFVADLFGAEPMAELPARLEPDGDGYRLAGSGWTLHGSEQVASKASSDVTLGVRAEAVVVDDVGPLRAVVTSVRRFGGRDRVELMVGGDRLMMWHEAPSPPVGETVGVRFASFHVFDAETGDAVHHHSR